jgi:hypothetical protein
MPIDSIHPEYERLISRWTKVADVVQGEEAVKVKGPLYLPVVGDDDLNLSPVTFYDRYKERANFYAATERTLNAVVGLMFQKAPTFEAPEDLKDSVQEAFSDAGEPLNVFAQQIVRRVGSTGRCGVLLDMPADQGERASPYAVFYTETSIINWETSHRVDEAGIVRDELEWVVLSEEHFETDKDKFDRRCIPQIRVLELQEGEYFGSVYR